MACIMTSHRRFRSNQVWVGQGSPQVNTKSNVQIWGSLPCIRLIRKGKEGLGKQRKHDSFKWKDTGTEPKQRQNTSQHNAASEFTKRKQKAKIISFILV